MLTTVSRVDVGHDDLIHDVAFDFYGQRMATCSSDQTVKVFDLSGKVGPDLFFFFSTTLTTCPRMKRARMCGTRTTSSRRTTHRCCASRGRIPSLARCWRRARSTASFASGRSNNRVSKSLLTASEKRTPTEPFNSGKRWTESARLVESRETILDIKFAPKHMGLKLVSVPIVCVCVFSPLTLLSCNKGGELGGRHRAHLRGDGCDEPCPLEHDGALFYRPRLMPLFLAGRNLSRCRPQTKRSRRADSACHGAPLVSTSPSWLLGVVVILPRFFFLLFLVRKYFNVNGRFSVTTTCPESG